MTGKVPAVYAILISAAIILSSCFQPSSGPGGLAEIGRAAPDFKLLNLKGEEVSLDQFKGKIVMLDFWATWCGPCRMVMPILERLQKEYADIMVQLSVNLQEPKDIVEDYVQNQGIHTPVLLDREGAVAQAYGAEAIPMQVIIDRKGVVRFIENGYTPEITLPRLRSEIEKLR